MTEVDVQHEVYNLDPDLVGKARLLRETELFVDPQPDVANVHKQTLFLVLAGAKPVGEVLSGHREATEDGWRSVRDNPETVASFLNSLGLAYDLSDSDEIVTQALVSRDPTQLREYRSAGDQARIGELFGYPRTAVEAFARGASMPIAEQDRLEAVHHIPLEVAGFRVSQEHWREEFEVMMEWYQLLARYDLIQEVPSKLT